MYFLKISQSVYPVRLFFQLQRLFHFLVLNYVLFQIELIYNFIIREEIYIIGTLFA